MLNSTEIVNKLWGLLIKRTVVFLVISQWMLSDVLENHNGGQRMHVRTNRRLACFPTAVKTDKLRNNRATHFSNYQNLCYFIIYIKKSVNWNSVKSDLRRNLLSYWVSFAKILKETVVRFCFSQRRSEHGSTSLTVWLIYYHAVLF